MAEKKKTADAPVTEQQEKTYTIRLPKTEQNSADVYVGINDRDWLIKRGVDVEVPECVYQVLRQSEEADEEAVNRRIRIREELEEESRRKAAL